MSEEQMTEEMAYTLATFMTWWNTKGSEIVPDPRDDIHQHAERIALVAWTAAMKRMRDDQLRNYYNIASVSTREFKIERMRANEQHSDQD